MTIARAAARRQFGAPVDGDAKELTGTEPADELALLSQSLVDLRVAIGAVSGEDQRAALVRELEQTRQAIADIETGHGHDPAREDDAPPRPGMRSTPAGQPGQQGGAEARGAKVTELPADVSEGKPAGERVADPTDRAVASRGFPRRRWLATASLALGVAALLFVAFFGGLNAATLFDGNTAAESAASAASTGLDRSAETRPPPTAGDVDRSAPATAADDSEASTATTAPRSTTDPVAPTTPVAPVARSASARNDRTANVGSELPDTDPAPTPGSSSTTTNRQTTTAPSSSTTAAPATTPARPATSPPTTQKPTTTAKPTTTTQPTTTTTTPGVPQLRSDFVEVEEDKGIKIHVLDNDQPGNAEFDEDTLTITTDPLHADEFRVHDDHIHYKSIEDYVGIDTIRYRVCNTNGLCAVASVTITVRD